MICSPYVYFISVTWQLVSYPDGMGIIAFKYKLFYR